MVNDFRTVDIVSLLISYNLRNITYYQRTYKNNSIQHEEDKVRMRAKSGFRIKSGQEVRRQLRSVFPKKASFWMKSFFMSCNKINPIVKHKRYDLYIVNSIAFWHIFLD